RHLRGLQGGEQLRRGARGEVRRVVAVHHRVGGGPAPDRQGRRQDRHQPAQRRTSGPSAHLRHPVSVTVLPARAHRSTVLASATSILHPRPCGRAESGRRRAGPACHPVSGAGVPTGTGVEVAVRLLVVEDEERLAAALRRGLQAEGFAVDVATDGPTGLDLARYGSYDAIILDVMLPGISGYQIVRTLRAESRWVPLLMLSAKDGEYDQADGLHVGADDYLTKPFSDVVLLARLRALLRRGAPRRPTVLTAGDLTLDPASREVTCAGAEVSLTSREFALLEYLMRRQGEVVSKIELLDHV